jgi:hypothetical protein
MLKHAQVADYARKNVRRTRSRLNHARKMLVGIPNPFNDRQFCLASGALWISKGRRFI